jgi:hypothetical protein
MLGLALLVIVVAAVAGIRAGNWIVHRRAVADEARRVDEYVGLGERTGLTGELELQVEPRSVTIAAGQPIKIELTLINKTPKPMMLNSWFSEAPAEFRSNQVPFKVIVTKAGKTVAFRGNIPLFPPHEKRDFRRFGPGKSLAITVADLSRPARIGTWDMSTPGVYSIEIWYETYLTGRHIGVNAWTGMTNHVVVQVTVKR